MQGDLDPHTSEATSPWKAEGIGALAWWEHGKVSLSFASHYCSMGRGFERRPFYDILGETREESTLQQTIKDK